MKKKINKYLLLTVVLTLMATLTTTVAIFHHMYKKQVIDSMETYAGVLEGMVSGGDELAEHYTDRGQDLRVTVIKTDGTVVFDTKAQEDSLDSHSDRPEVREAIEKGTGYAVRHSDTLDSDMYYYAVRMGDGSILRVSKEADSLWRVFSSTLRGILAVGLLLFVVCLLLARYLTYSLIRPIERLAANIDGMEGPDTYEELIPFITMIREQHEDIMKSVKMRQEFTANVSHELKTPLTSISGYAELIETGIAGENDIQRFAREIHRNSKRLLTLINDIIRLSELDSEHLEMSYTKVDLYDLSAVCVESLRLNAEKHGIKIDCSGSKCMVYANREMVEELLYNLCDNAIRYNRLGGSVEVITGMRGMQPYVMVKDTGIGIPKESQDRIFERFYRVDKSRSKLTGGTGLGLAIVKHIVTQLGAQIELKSEFGKGTEITVLFSE